MASINGVTPTWVHSSATQTNSSHGANGFGTKFAPKRANGRQNSQHAAPANISWAKEPISTCNGDAPPQGATAACVDDERVADAANEQKAFFGYTGGAIVAGLVGLWPLLAAFAVNAVEKAVYASLKKGGLQEPTTPAEIRDRATREALKNTLLGFVFTTISAMCFLFFFTGVGFVGGTVTAAMAFDRFDRTSMNLQRYFNADKSGFEPFSMGKMVSNAGNNLLYRLWPARGAREEQQSGASAAQ